MLPSISNLSKPTPKKLKLIGNCLLIIGGGLSTSLMGIPEDVVSLKMKYWTMFGVSQLSMLGKLFTSMYTIEAESKDDGQV